MTTSVSLEGRLFIDGEFQESSSGRRYDVINPADESVVASAADANAEDVTRAVTPRSRRPRHDWSATTTLFAHSPQAVPGRAAQRIRGDQHVLVAEAGTLASVHPTHVDAMIDDMGYFNGLIETVRGNAIYPPTNSLGMRSRRRIRYEPYGVVGAITPWNAPFMTNIWKVGHALATGNTVVLKSAPDTPLTGALMARIAADKTEIPAGIFNAISSADKAVAGEALTTDTRVGLLHFTGSPGVGQRIAQNAAVGIRHVVLELGGKSANVLLPDADLDMACGLGVAMCMSSSGQGCALATRMVVHGDIYDDVIARLQAMVGTAVGDPPMRPTWWVRSSGWSNWNASKASSIVPLRRARGS